MAIPFVSGEGFSRVVSVNVVNRLVVKPPEIFITKTHVLTGEELVIKWKPSPYFTKIRVTLAHDGEFTNVFSTVTAENPDGSKLGKYPAGTFYVRAMWEPSSVQNPKG